MPHFASRDDRSCPAQFDKACVARQIDAKTQCLDRRGHGTVAGGRIGRRTHRRDQSLIRRCLHGHDRVAGIDRALEGMRIHHVHDVGHLRHAEQGGDTRHHVLAEGRRGRQHMAVSVLRRGDDLRRVDCGQWVRVCGIGDGEHLGHAIDFRGVGGDGVRRVGQHQYLDGIRLQFTRAGDAACRTGIEFAVQMFGDDQDLGHYSNPFVFNAATSSAASFTITPLLRLGGGA